MKRVLFFIAVVFLAGCELEEVVTADSEDVVIVEMYLRTDVQTQVAVLHRTGVLDDSTTEVRTTRFDVSDGTGRVVRFVPGDDVLCGVAPNSHVHGTCYRSDPATPFRVTPGQTYDLRIVLAEGGIITGTTNVPADFELIRPTESICNLPPATTFDIVWTASPDAWVYASEINIRGLNEHLPLQVEDPLRLFGLSVSSSDTTISFPNEFGLFDRFENDLTEALVLIQGGLPPGTVTDAVIAAADRNYVNWERGGNFNPSGVVRIGSLRGAGFGVFGSLVAKHFRVHVGSTDPTLPPC
ncbi:MAG TPA: hypothetical protein VGD49_00730 [Longimicrobiales bacterium]